MIALLLALASSLAYGCADFLGGVAARRAHVLRTIVIAAPASLAVELTLWPVLGATWSTSALAWGAASGVASAAAFALLYRTLAIGPMSVLSPVTALVSAALPVTVSLAQDEHIDTTGLAGMPLALIAVVLVSAGRPAEGNNARPSRTALLLALAAGTAIAVQLICLHQSPTTSGLAPIITGRAVSSAIVLTVAAARHGRIGTGKPSFGLAAMAGALDSLANLAFLFAVRHGNLAVVAVITALYPAATILLARVVLTERIHRGQLVGLGVAAIAVSLLALS